MSIMGRPGSQEGQVEETQEVQKSLCSVFARGMDAYHRQSWEEAIKLFNAAMQLRNDDGPSRYYHRLCEKYRADPPPTPWNGIVYLNKK